MEIYTSNTMEQSRISMSAIEDVRLSYARCRQNEDFFDAFYDHFARKSPEIGALFAQTDMERQNELLKEAITNLISFAEEDEKAVELVNEIGLTHNRENMDIKIEWYPLWEEALHDTIRESDPKLNSKLLEAWTQVLQPGIDHLTSLY